MQEGSRKVEREIEYYNLDVIISVGYRVKSPQGTQFRIWATQRLKKYIIKGFALNDDRFKSGNSMNYFDELQDRLREIRISERFFYQKIKDIYTTSIDYDPKDEKTKEFFKVVQNKLITAFVSGEVVEEGNRINNTELIQSQFRSAQSTATIGKVLAEIGLPLGILGSIIGNAPLALVGNISYGVGVPMIGIAAGNMERSAALLNSSYVPNPRGWGWYWTSLGTGVLASILLQNAISEFNNANTIEEQEDARSGLPVIVVLSER